MTSGTKNWDYRVYTSIPGNHGCYPPAFSVGLWLGRHGSKTWSGGNSPVNSPRPVRLRTVRYALYDENGLQTGVRVRYLKEYPLGQRAPMTENGYSFTIFDNYELAYSGETYNCPIPNPSGYGSTVLASSTYGQFGMNSYDDPLLMWGANDTISLVGKLNDALSGGSFNMAVFLGEGRESLATIANAASRIARSVRALKKGNLKRAAESLVGKRPRKHGANIPSSRVTEEWISSNWLQLQYGWIPLLKDIYGAAEHFAHMQNRPQVLTYRVSRRKGPIPTTGQPSPSVALSGSKEYGSTLKALVRKIDEYALLGLKDPASLAWELLPWSFVADWIIPVGNYLEAINLNRALSATYVTSWKYTNTYFAARSVSGAAIFSASFQHKTVMGGRTVSSSLNVSLPTVKGWDQIPSWKRAANSIALVIQAFTGRR